MVLADELTVRFVSVAGATDGGRGEVENGTGETATLGAWGFRLTAKGRKVLYGSNRRRPFVFTLQVGFRSRACLWKATLCSKVSRVTATRPFLDKLPPHTASAVGELAS